MYLPKSNLVHYSDTKVFCKYTLLFYNLTIYIQNFPTEDNSMFGERIRSLRIARNLSQVQLAEKLGVSKQSISNWENNNILPSIDMLKNIAIFFSCSTDYLLELNNNRHFIETTNLSMEQTALVQQIIDEIEQLNRTIQNINV